jgi:hypothetical protein
MCLPPRGSRALTDYMRERQALPIQRFQRRPPAKAPGRAADQGVAQAVERTFAIQPPAIALPSTTPNAAA